MSKINDLIKELCPNGVEYKTLYDVCDRIYAGGTPSTSNEDYYDGNIKWLRSGEINFNELYDTEIKITELGLNKSSAKMIPAGSVVIAMTGATVARTGMIMREMSMNQSVCALIPKKQLNFRFLYQVLSNKYLELKQSGQGVLTSLNLDKIKKIVIPIPPLAVQQEIVRILDKFGELEAEIEAELEAELEARERQYEYWRGKLLKGTKKYKLGDIAKFTYGFTDKALENGTARYIRITDISENGYLLNNDCKYLNITEENKKYVLEKGNLVVARTGASYGKTLYFDSDIPGIYASFLIKIDLDNNIILNKYYWHFSKSSLYWNQANNLVSKAGQPQFNSNAIKKIEIEVPSIEEQQRIIKILDKFESLINDISEGLPAEIELRRKQYEYYRNKLLNFEEPVVSE